MSKQNSNLALVPSAAIRNETLVLNLPDAVNPVVWQFDLSTVRASAIELNGGPDGFILRLKTPRGETHDIAIYAQRDQAVSVLTVINQTLVGDTPKGAKVTAATAAPEETSGNWPLAVCALLLLVVIFWGLGRLLPPPTASSVAEQTIATPSIKSGQPQSADDVLQGRVP